MRSLVRRYPHHRPVLLLVREGGGGGEPDPMQAPSDAASDDDDALEELADEITTLAAHIHAATQRLLELIAEFDRRGGWKAGGHRSCAHWLAFRTGVDLGTAREKVRTARVLAGLPETSASMARGELSFSAVRALTRVATPDNEGDLLELARGCTTAQLERIVRGWRLGSRATEAERERERHRRRKVSIFPGDDGMYVVRGRVTAEVGALLMTAIDAASDALWREEAGPLGVVTGTGEDTSGTRPASLSDETTAAAARRRADALALVAELAMSVGFGGRAARVDRGRHGADAGDGARSAAAGSDEAPAAAAPLPPISGTRAERYQIMIHVSPETLSGDGGRGQEPPDGAVRVSAEASRASTPGSFAPAAEHVSAETSSVPTLDRSHLHDGTRLPAETSRRLACDAARVLVARTPDGSLLNVGRRSRTVSPALRRALEVRDRGCRFPGCGMRFTDAHHVRHWADGGVTSLGNCLLLCRHHHRLVHEGGWRVEWWGEGRPAFHDPRGDLHFEGRWSPPALGEAPVEALVAAQRARGIDPDWRTAGARWKREADIPTDVYLRASEATG